MGRCPVSAGARQDPAEYTMRTKMKMNRIAEALALITAIFLLVAFISSNLA